MAVAHVKNVSLPLMNILRTTAVPIIHQLHLEERLLRTSSDNWCIINDGTDTPTIVMGVSGNQKFGGNAQSITRERWIHHTSFLWDYDAKNMKYLKLPSRAPKYRSSRDHADFLCPMKDYLASSSEFIGRTIAAIQDHFSLRPVELDAVIDPSAAAYPHSTRLLLSEEVEAALASMPEEPAPVPATYA